MAIHGVQASAQVPTASYQSLDWNSNLPTVSLELSPFLMQDCHGEKGKPQFQLDLKHKCTSADYLTHSHQASPVKMATTSFIYHHSPIQIFLSE